jgi:cyclopropane-fatty-acyl-phospholipid synthase
MRMWTDSIVPDGATESRRGRGSLLDRAARSLVVRAMERLEVGSLVVVEDGTRTTFGEQPDTAAMTAKVTVDDPRFYRALVWGGTLGAGEAYIDGWWRCDDLTTLIRILIRNEHVFAGLNGTVARLTGWLQRGWHALRRNTRGGSRRNIAAHYDLSNDFYRLFLDETMTYSCGIFERPDSTLYDASVAKLDRICRKLMLSPADHVVEIGTGWGSFALHAAKRYGCRVTTTTISRQQYELARERVAAAGLEDRITVLLKDYRDLTGQYDKLVSIEMVEAVGWQYYDAYMRQCSRLLKPDGVACIQAITMADRYYERAKREVDFIKRYVFPGSCIPSVGALTTSVTRATDMTVAHVEDITPHYATTLRAWHDRFLARVVEVRALGFPEAFVRLWVFYLCYCEAGFRERTIGDVHMLLVKPRFRGALPLGLLEAERAA